MTHHRSTPPSPQPTDGDFDAFYAQCEKWRRHLLRTWPTFSDIDAEITASMWEHWTNGVRDEREMFNRVTVDVKRFVRREARQFDVAKRIGATTPRNPANSAVDDLIDEIGRAQLLAKVTIPDQVRPWAEHRCGYRERITEAERLAGFRWAKRERQALSHA